MTTVALSDWDIVRAGKSTFTLSNAANRWTFKVVRKANEGRPPVFFVSLLTGPDNSRNYTYLGILQDDGSVRLTAKSGFRSDSLPYRAVNWLLGNLRNGQPLTHGFRLQFSDRCQRCGRKLTVPSSIDNRLGPECAGLV